MLVRVLGCGDAFGSGGRLQTCFYLEAGDGRFLIDCGATSMVSMHQQGIDPGCIDTVLLSHLHGDHFGGLPLLLLEAQFVGRRQRPLTVAGPPGTRERLWRTMEALFPGASAIAWRFPLEIVELAAGHSQPFGDLGVLPIEVVHPSDAPAYALRLSCGDRIVAYSGDTAWTDALPAVARDADLLLIECYGYRPVAKSHLDYQTLCAHLPELRAKRMVLTHMSQEMLDRLDEIDIEAAYDGMEIALPDHAASQRASVTGSGPRRRESAAP